MQNFENSSKVEIETNTGTKPQNSQGSNLSCLSGLGKLLVKFELKRVFFTKLKILNNPLNS